MLSPCQGHKFNTVLPRHNNILPRQKILKSKVGHHIKESHQFNPILVLFPQAVVISANPFASLFPYHFSLSLSLSWPATIITGHRRHPPIQHYSNINFVSINFCIMTKPIPLVNLSQQHNQYH